MKSKTRSFIYSSVLIVVLSVCVVCAGIGFTSAWFTDSASATATLTMGKAVSFSLYDASSNGNTTTSIGTPNVNPGDYATFNAVYIQTIADASVCFVRAKIELPENTVFEVVNNKANAVIGSGVSDSYNWVYRQEDGFYYLTNGTTLNGTVSNLYAVYSTNRYKFQVNNVRAKTTADNDDGGANATVTVTFQAIQAANYTHTAWSQVTWNA